MPLLEDQEGSNNTDRAIQLLRDELALYKPAEVDLLEELATTLEIKFSNQGYAQDINEAIELRREVLAHHPPTHPDRGISLNKLANAVARKFQEKGDVNDINEVIQLHREALELHALPHPNYVMSLNNLAGAISRRFAQQGDSKDIDKAIELHREALAFHSPPHPARGTSLNNLANAIHRRFWQKRDSEDIHEAIELQRQSLALLPLSHPGRSLALSHLAEKLHSRFAYLEKPEDICEALELYKEALALCKTPHPARASFLTALASSLSAFYGHSKDCAQLDQACALFHEAVIYASSPPRARFYSAWEWGRNAARYGHISALHAYNLAIGLLPQLAGLHLELSSRQEMLSIVHQRTALTLDAASCAVGFGQLNVAMEFLEASRSVFWSRALHLRPPLEGLVTVHPELAHRLEEVSRQLEAASFRDNTRNRLTETQQTIISMESEIVRCRQLNEEWEELVKSIRLLHGFEDFLQPKDITVLMQAARSGPIIILASTDSACSALIVKSTQEVQCLRLPQVDLPYPQYIPDLSRGPFSVELETLLAMNERNNPTQDVFEFEARLIGGPEWNLNAHPDDVFQKLLASLWRNIVKPVFEVLNFQKSLDPPRLWWCPTGKLTFLPLHAAGIYGGDTTDCASDYVISSYTPTLAALLHHPARADATTQFKMTAIIQPEASNYPTLPGAREELKKITQRVPKEWLTVLGDTAPATVPSALNHLRGAHIMHFACHGMQDLENPLESGFILTDGRLKVSRVMRPPEADSALDVKNSMSIAFLSACEIAKGDKNSPDEAMHLAATLLFAGFHGVVATMWIMNDLDGPKIADAFYEHLFKDCDPNSNPPVVPDLTQAAKALHFAVAKLRQEPDISFRRWVPFVHYGL